MKHSVRKTIFIPRPNPEADGLIARFTSPVSAARRELIQYIYANLKFGPIGHNNILAKHDQLYWTASENEQAGQQEWITGTHALVPAGAILPTHVVDRGYLGNGLSGHVLWGTALINTGGQYSQNSGCLWAWETLDIDAATHAIGTTGVNSSQFVQGRSSGNPSGRLNDTTSLSAAAPTSVGLTAINRSGSTSKQLYKNGVSIATSATGSSATGLSDTICLLRNNAIYSTRRVGAAGKANTLTANDHLDLYNIFQTVMTAIGA